MHAAIRAVAALATFSALISPIQAQQRVDPRSMYERCMAVVPLVGKGTLDDPKRPLYAPLPSALKPGVRTGILGYTHVLSDDGKSALTEFVARDRSAFNAILSDKSIKAFLKGKDKKGDAEAEFKKYKKDFDINKFGVRMQ
jgi:hypothetical protein